MKWRLILLCALVAPFIKCRDDLPDYAGIRCEASRS